eukprot:m.127292 g.127292  ORF g.127292 m.127292 type:complete len:566 (-) comp15654_c0_seq5:294-1991(-)
MAARTPTDIGSALYTVLREANTPEKHSDDAFNNLLEFAFTNIHILRNLGEKQRIAAVWHLVELGGIPLIVSALQPNHKAMSMGMTLMGMLFKDENLLSHKLGRLILTNKKFLPAIESGLQLGKDAMLPLLVSQVLHNVMRTASSEHLKEIASFGSVTQQLLFLIKHSLEEQHDWRLTFVTVDMILLLEIANAHDVLDQHEHFNVFMTLLEKKNRKAVTEHEPVLNRCLACLFLWAMRTRHTRDATLQSHREALFDLVRQLKEDLPEAFTLPDEIDGKPPPGPHQAASTINICIALDKLMEGDESSGLPLHLTIKSRVRNWDAIEKDAEQKVRSPDFKKLHLKSTGQTEEDSADKSRLIEVSSDESDADDDADDDSDDDADKHQKQQVGQDQVHVTAAPSQEESKTAESESVTASDTNVPLPQEQSSAATLQLEQALLQKSSAKKTEGTTYFRGEMYDDAYELYLEAAEILKQCSTPSKALQEELCRLYSNCAECRLRQENYQAALELCDAAITYDPSFTKSHFRKAKAYKALGDVAKAEEELRKLLAVDTTNKSAIQMLQDLKKK